MPVLLNYSKDLKWRRPNSFYEARITLIPNKQGLNKK
jgi:hypothetical protein